MVAVPSIAYTRPLGNYLFGHFQLQKFAQSQFVKVGSKFDQLINIEANINLVLVLIVVELLLFGVAVVIFDWLAIQHLCPLADLGLLKSL